MRVRVTSGVVAVLLIIWGAFFLPGGTPAGEGQVSGAWILRVMLDEYGSGTALFQQEGSEIRGTFTGPPAVQLPSGGWDYVPTDLAGTVRGNQIQFSFETSDGERVTYAGTIGETTMQGTCDYAGSSRACTWQAWRRPSVWGL